MSSPYLLLIDSRVPDIEGIISGLMEGVDHLIFDYSVDTYESLKTKIPKSYDCVGIAQHNQYSRVYSFLLNELNMGLSYLVPGSEPETWVERSLAESDSTLSSWSSFIDFLTWLKTERGMINYDLLACNLLEDSNWVYAINTIKTAHNIHVRASLNITGEGGDFILESDNVNLIGLCFSENIAQYKYSFEQANAPVMMFDGTGALWMCGKNNLGQMGLGNLTNQQTLVKINPQPSKTIKTIGNASHNTVHISFTDGTLYATGFKQGSSNFLFRTGATADSNVFVECDMVYNQLPGKTVKKSQSNNISIATFLTDDGYIYSSGQNSSGIFGNSSVAVNGTGIAGQLYQMENTTSKTIVDYCHLATAVLVLMNDGTIYTIGQYNGMGLGANGTSSSLLQVQLPLGESVKQISGSTFNCVGVLTTNNKVYITATSNNAFIFCNGTNTNNINWNLIPLPEGKTPAGISAGNGCFVVLFTDGTLYGAGDNSSGQLGLNTASRGGTNSMAQIPIPSNKFVVQMQYYNFSLIVLTADGYVYATGGNSGNGAAGILGTNDSTTRKTLTQMLKTVDGVVSNMTSITRLNMPFDPIPGVIASTAPGAPTLGAVTAGNGQLSVEFSPPASDGGAVVTTYKYSLNGGAYVDAGTTVSPIVITGLTNGTAYTVTLKAVNSVGDGTASSTSAATTPEVAPGAPTLGTVTAGNQQLSVAFAAPTDNGGSAITTYKYSLNGGAFVDAGTTVSPIVITGLTNGTAYTVALKAVNTMDGASSATSAAYMPDVLPNAPAITSVVAGNKRLTVHFDAPVANGASAYTCKYSVNGGELTTFDHTVSPLVLTGLTNGTEYTVSLVSVNQLGTSVPASTATGTPAPGVPNAVVVNSAQVVASTTAGAHGKVSITFTEPNANDDGGITGYHLIINGVSTAVGSAGSPYVATVAPGDTYTFGMTATNAVGTSAPSNTVELTPVFVPENPVITAVDASSGSLAVHFTAGHNGGSSVTSLEYSVNGGASFTTTTNLSSPLTVAGLTNGTLCTVIVRAVNAIGKSGYSNAVEATPRGVPDTPAVSVVAGVRSVTIAVTEGANQGAAVTQYAYSLNGGDTYTLVSPAATLEIAELASNVAVSVRVYVTNSVGNSAPTAAVSALPYDVPDAPSGVSATAGNQQLAIAFTAGSDNGRTVTAYEYSLNGGVSYTSVDAAGFVSPYTVTGLTNGQSYSVKVRAVNVAGASSAAAAASAAVPFGVPLNTRITGITLGTGSASVHVACTPNGRSVLTYYYSFDGTNWIDAATAVSPIQLNYLQNGYSYTVMVKAENAAGVSADSQTVSFMPYTPQSPPGAPVIESAVPGDRQVTVHFTDGSNNGSPIVGYKYTVDGTNFVWATETTSPLLIDGLVNQQTYSVQIKAVNGTGDSAASDAVSVTPVGAPGAPIILSTHSNAAVLSVAYSVPELNGNAAADVWVQYRLTTVSTGSYLDSDAVASNGAFALSDIGLSDGVEYELRLRVSVGAVAEPSAWSLPATVYPPPTPVMSSYNQMDKSFSVTFSNVIDPSNVMGFKYKMDSADYQWMDYIPAPTYTFTGLTNRSINRNPNKTYSLKFKTINFQGEESAEIGPYIFSAYGPPELPTMLSITPGNTWINLKILTGDAGSLTTPSYDYTFNGGATYRTGGGYPDASGIVSFDLYPLENRTTYSFMYRARTNTGASAWSPVYTATPLGRPWTQTIQGVTTNGTTAFIAVNQLFNNNPGLTCFNRPDLFINGPGNVAAYQCSLDGGNTYVYLPNVVSPLQLHGLTNGNTYTVKVKVISTYQQESWPSNSYTFTIASVPDALSVVSVTPGDQSLQVVVLPGSNGGSAITQYQYSLNGGNTFTQANTVALASSQIGMTIPGLSNGTSYSISVRAVNANGNSIATPVLVSAAPVGTPSAPTITDVSFVAGVAYVYFTAAETNGAGTILIYKYTFDAGSTFKYTAGNTSPLAITGLSYGSTYPVQIAAYTDSGITGSWSASRSLSSTAAPDTPVITSISVQDQSIAVVFIPGSSNGSTITGYEYSLDGTTYASISTTSVSGGKLSATISGLTNGTAYSFQLRAVNVVGSSVATHASQSYIPIGTPAAPTITDVVCEPGTAYVYFTAGAVNGPGSVATYKYSLDSGVSYRFSEGNASPIILRDLSDGVSYAVQMVAYTTTGLQSSDSNAFEFNTSGVPSVPSISAVVPGDQLIQLTIVPGSSNGGVITGYEYSLNGSTTFTAISATNSGTCLTITGLTNGESYTAAIRAINSVGHSPVSIPSAIVVPFSILAATQITRIEPADNGLRVFISNAAIASIFENDYTITGYKYALDGETFNGEVSTSSSTDFLIPGLTNGSLYTVAIKAITSAGITGKSNVIVDAKPYTVSAAPTINSVVSLSKKAVITFTAGAENGSPIVGYRYRINGAGEIYTALTTSSPITIYGLENAQGYTVELYAVNAAGLSEASAVSDPFMPFDVPYAPVITNVIPGNARVYVYFNEINTNGSPLLALRYSLGAAAIDVSGLTSPLTIPGLLNKATYNVAILAVNAAGQSAASNFKSVIVGTPTAPVITSIVPGPKNLTVNFTAPNDNGSAIIGYMWAERGTTKYNKFLALTSPGMCLGLTNGQSYNIVMYAVNKNGMSVASNSLGGRIPFDVPSKPTITSVIPMLGRAELSFTAPPTNGSPIIKYQYALNADTTFTDLSGMTSPVIITNLPNNANYTIKMIAINAAGASIVSPPSKAVMYKYLPPAQPKVASLVAGYNKLTVAFTPPLANGAPITTYLYALNGSTTYINSQTSFPPLVITNGITNNTNYNITIIAVNSAGQSIASAPLAKPVSFVWLPPLIPVIKTVTSGNQSATVDFTPPLTRGPAITGYSYSFNNGTTNYDLSGQLTSPFTIGGLTNDVSYNLTIAAMSSAGYSARSVAKLFMPVYKAPAAPVIGTILSTTAGTLNVNFTAGSANGSPITGYKYTFNGGNTVVNAGVSVSPIIITGLITGKSYIVQLIATNALGDSPLSAAKAAAPK